MEHSRPAGVYRHYSGARPRDGLAATTTIKPDHSGGALRVAEPLGGSIFVICGNDWQYPLRPLPFASWLVSYVVVSKSFVAEISQVMIHSQVYTLQHDCTGARCCTNRQHLYISRTCVVKGPRGVYYTGQMTPLLSFDGATVQQLLSPGDLLLLCSALLCHRVLQCP
ncbi:hypothetical protein MRB53_039403 [Persea americana]|nr:hypothetical protein MRB53_039403 [Persea americana]